MHTKGRKQQDIKFQANRQVSFKCVKVKQCHVNVSQAKTSPTVLILK